MKKYGSIKHYIAFLRRQPAHMQHIYAVIFAGSITALLAAFILYVDYGFWHEKYVRSEESSIGEAPQPSQSPFQMMSIFFKTARNQLDTLGTSGADLLVGKEVYIRSNVEQSSSTIH